MKFVNEYRDGQIAQKYARALSFLVSKSWTIMEICGGQTHSIVKYGIDQLLPPEITLIHGPGCPVCVTPIELIDEAIAIANQDNTILCSFGDMLRVPGSQHDLLSIKATGKDIRIVYSPLDAIKIAQDNPTKEVVFFGVGFETTAPATAMSVYQAFNLGLKNFSILVSHVLVPPAMEALLSSPETRVQGFLLAGHVCTIMGYTQYEPIAQKYQIPLVVTGFEPVDILQGIYMCIKQLEENRHEVENQYSRSVKKEGNENAQKIITEVFKIVNRNWRGIGEIAESGLGLQDKYIDFDASHKFNLTIEKANQNIECISGLILQGIKKPQECSAFGNNCTPEHPLGAPMVSSEGACAAYYRYRQV